MWVIIILNLVTSSELCLVNVYKCRVHRPAAGRRQSAQARLGTDTKDSFFLEPVTLTPTWMRPMCSIIKSLAPKQSQHHI